MNKPTANVRPSFADEFYQSTYGLAKMFARSDRMRKVRGDIDKEMQNYRILLRRANRFQLDDDLVEYVTRVSSTTTVSQMAKRLHSAVPPYETTWIEFNLHRKVETIHRLNRELLNDPVGADMTQISPLMGILIERDPQRPTAWVMTMVSRLLATADGSTTLLPGPHFTEFMFDPAKETTRIAGHPSLRATRPRMSERERILYDDVMRGSPWGYTTHDDRTDLNEVRIPSALEGFSDLGSTKTFALLLSAAGNDDAQTKLSQFFIQDMREHTGMLRWTVTLLAMLAEVPVSSSDTLRAPGQRLVGTVRRPYMEFHRLAVKIPRINPIRFIERKLDHAAAKRHRAHEVRSHWRTYLTIPRCEHDWAYDDMHQRKTCLRCAAHGVLVKEHVRGDATLGWVRKEYVLQKTPGV